MAYAALLSTKQTITRILDSYHNSNLPSCPEIKNAYRAVARVMETHVQVPSLESISWSRERECADLERWIREAVYLSELSQEIDSFTTTVKKLEKEYFTMDVQAIKWLPEEDYVVSSSRIHDFGGKNSKMVGLHDELCKLIDRLTSDDSDSSDNVARCLVSANEESWHLLRGNLFDNELCPLELEKAGKKIAEICEGLPLAIIAAGNHLSRAEKTLEYWNKVAEKKIPIFNGADDETPILEVLYSSYKYLPQHLKACFLYMGVFPQGYEIPASKLINLWRAEGSVIEEEEEENLFVTSDPLEKLVASSLVLVCQQSSSDRIKTCKLHYIFQHMCVVEAAKDKFFHILSRHANSFGEGIRDQRGLCVHKNVLFAIKDVYNSMASVSTTVRSLLCTGPHHQYSVPMCFVLRLIRVLDALTIRFYNFPIEVLKLLQLRYLAFTYDGKLPASISKLWNLQYLIVRPHLSIKSPEARSYLPKEIWNMQELRHLQVMGSDLPDPPRGASLPKLLSLLDINAHTLTKAVLEGPKWEVNEGSFSNLKFLLIEDTDLEYWETYANCFARLERLIIRHCYKLKVIHLKIEYTQTLQKIELVDCSTLAVAAAKQIIQQQQVGRK
ncbi:hypothetical protein BUALT_Bualt08G0134000 [Buddleja alternifolia]|uniref:Disease resistance protein winged helix domain-containing protein n=1 Tax=Buddleja alternifolia TaxID=168488 RepID=A0AAV6XH67_9LAMI|nr:hypothetical protein BUALT_Bualt08G0134000 [Buddleja alternifolia]